VVFADVVGSTSMGERLDPEELVELMNGAFTFMGAAVNRYGGTVERLMGDSVLAFFGARQLHEDDAERAVRAGLEIRDQAAAYGEQVRSRHGVEFQVRVGINTGLVVAGRVGSDLGEEFTATGDAPNVAARLQAAAAPGTVLISASTHRLTEHAFDFRAMGPLAVKGKSAPVEAWEVLAAQTAPGSGRGLEGHGLSSPLVGRDAELALLLEKVRRLSDGVGAMVAVVGEAGLGKSRLLAELHAALSPGTRWLEARALSYGQSLPYHPWKALARQLLGAADDAGSEGVREKVRSLGSGGFPERSLPYLELLVGLPAEGMALAEGEALVQAMSGAVLDLTRHALGVAGRSAPLVLVLDDLHWADRASLELVAQVASLAVDEPLLLLGVLRPDKRAPSWALLDRLRGSLPDHYTQLELAPLGPIDSRRLLENLLRVDDLPDELRARILARSEGNPFYLEEVLRSLIDSGLVVSTGDRWRTVGNISEVSIPDTLAGVLAERIDRLPDQARRVAQTASVLGREFPSDTLEAMCRSAPVPERIEHVQPHLLTLTYEELVKRRADASRLYRFKHALTREAAYGLLLRARRRQLHALAGGILEMEMESAGRREELAPIVGLHFFEAGVMPKAASYLAEAARGARKLYALREEGEHWEHVLTALDQVPDPDPELLYEAVEKWIFVRVRLDELDGVLGPEPDRTPSSWYLRAERLARERGDKARLARFLSWIANAYMRVGRTSKGLDRLQESARLATELGDDGLMMLPLFLATSALAERNPAAAVEQAEHVLDLTRQNGDLGTEAHTLGIKAIALARLGRFEEARRALADMFEVAPRSGSRVKLADAHISAAIAYNDMGDLDEAMKHGRIGAEMADSAHAIECACFGYFEVGKSRLARHELGDAMTDFRRSLEFGETITGEGWASMNNRIGSHAARTRFEQGAEEAVRDLEKALENARRAGDAFGVANISELLAGALLRLSRVEEAAALLRDAEDFYRRGGLTTFLARALELSAQASERDGRPEEARHAREEAASLRAAAPPATAQGA
jgi:class 3 adenylate cyclase/tetratricopeptide (TPR) repeat protein